MYSKSEIHKPFTYEIRSWHVPSAFNTPIFLPLYIQLLLYMLKLLNNYWFILKTNKNIQQSKTNTRTCPSPHRYMCVWVYFSKSPRDQKRGAPAHRGKNSFLESYISSGICLMSAPVERYIEHVRRPLAVRSGIQITSENVTAHSVSTPHPLYLPLPRPIINERLR